MKKIFCTSLAGIMMICCLCFSGCKYSSSYSATMLVQNTTSGSVNMSFGSLEGTKAYSLKSGSGSGLKLCYSAKLESGSATVYYDYDDTKRELFSIEGGNELNGEADITENSTVYVVLESNGKIENGNFSFLIG